MFAYPGVLVSRDAGAFIVVDYNELRDINRRDEIPERRVRAQICFVGRAQAATGSRIEDRRPGTFAISRSAQPKAPKFIVVYLHGQGGSRKQGVDDFTFGGNFNRIKN